MTRNMLQLDQVMKPVWLLPNCHSKVQYWSEK